jgi:uncharacterized damage-inducible protein DinB
VTAAEARRLFGYTEWANARLVAALAPLSDQALAQPVASSFGSLRDTLAHVIAGEWIWLRRFKNETPTAMPDWVKGAGRAELLSMLAAVEAERRAFLAELTDEALERPLEYRLLSGAAHRDRLADLIQHVVNHSTYHRGQAVTQLRQLGLAPPSTDLVAFLWETR